MTFNMNDEIADDIAVEELVKDHFGLQVDIKQMIVRDIPVSHTAVASVFLTAKHQVFAIIRAHSAQTLGDVRKIAKRMGLAVDAYLASGHDDAYFNKIAREKFRQVFPGRHDITEEELRYYCTLVPYNPALLRVKSISGGAIKQFDSHDSSQWRVAAKFAYKQITTV